MFSAQEAIDYGFVDQVVGAVDQLRPTPQTAAGFGGPR